jgi:predicted transcriptional regulator YheO
MSSKITIIGAGSVGATIAYTLSSQDIASEIVLIDINKQKAEGEVLDIIQGTCFRDPISIIAGDYEDAKDSDIVIITSGIARKPGQTRLELTQTNVNILKSITPEIVKAAPNALYLIVSNPVDIMTYVFTKISGLPENQILGSGTILDSARLRCGLSEHFQIAQSNIHAYVFGEHGDTSFIPWSGAYISGVSVDEYYELEKKLGKDIEPMKDSIQTFSNGPKDRFYKSFTTLIPDENGKIVGSVCVNLDVSDLLNAQRALGAFVQYPMTHHAPTNDIDALATKNVDDILKYYMKQAELLVGKPMGLMNKEEKIRALDYLDQKGVFKISKTSVLLCETLQVSKYTLYNYLEEARSGRGDNSSEE